MNDDILIVSMTSWPKRIEFVAKAIHSILQQNVSKELYHIVLVLAETEFPNKEKDLPDDLVLMHNANLFEIIWTPTNTFSHKKLLPTLKRYPNNPILVTDEDLLRPQDWLKTFINDHKTYPNDVLVGGCVFDVCFDGDTFNPKKRFKFDDCDCVGKEIIHRRPANGFGGVLYPAHTFTDERFFDEELMMKLSAYSDESWQFCFNIMGDKTIRWISKHFEFQHYQQKGSMINSMTNLRSRNKNNSYIAIYNNLMTYFPEFKEKLKRKIYGK